VVVGAYSEDSSATGIGGNQNNDLSPNSGAAYVFTRSASIWSQQAYVKASNTNTGDTFGWAVSVSGNTVVATGYQERSAATGVDGDQADNNAPNAGAAYVFLRGPEAPVITGITPGNGQLSVAFTPGSDGGSPLTNYEYSIDNGANFTPRAPTSTVSPLLITGLTNGTSYTVRLRSVNAEGTGLQSASSVGTPRTVPGAPTGVIGIPGNQRVVVSFSPPASNGGATLTGYTVTASPGGLTGVGASSPLAVPGLTNGVA
jgi:hypothetical protein